MDEEAREMATELAEILAGMKENLERANTLADKLQEHHQIEVLSSVEVVGMGVKSAMRELPEE
ncbi:MAG: hypothetical protein ACOC8K_00715 [Gemmatimonadota bacterium]